MLLEESNANINGPNVAPEHTRVKLCMGRQKWVKPTVIYPL